MRWSAVQVRWDNFITRHSRYIQIYLDSDTKTTSFGSYNGSWGSLMFSVFPSNVDQTSDVGKTILKLSTFLGYVGQRCWGVTGFNNNVIIHIDEQCWIMFFRRHTPAILINVL